MIHVLLTVLNASDNAMVNWFINGFKCLFGFHDYSKWVEHEETAGLGTHVYYSRFCKSCNCVSYNGLG